jgi:hypothetical protein
LVTLGNTGTIAGAIQTGAGNDGLTNATTGVWNAVSASVFGAGDDTRQLTHADHRPAWLR